MAFEPVNSWDMALIAAGETVFGTPLIPAAAKAFELISFDGGVMETGEIRDKKDRNTGRGMRGAWVEGRVKPMPFSFEASVKSRAAVDTDPQETAVYQAAGLSKATSAGVSVTYSLPAEPIVSTPFVGLTLYRLFGKSPYVRQAEMLRGGVVKTLSWSGGDKELTLKAGGDAIGKYVLGYAASVTLADGSGTTLTFNSVEEGLRFGIGWYQIESEIIKITTPSTVSSAAATITRAQGGTTGAAHSAQPIRPYIPSLTYAGSPISEGATVTVTVDSQVLRAMSFDISLTSGMDLLPGESGSKYIQGVSAKRYDVTASLKMVLHTEDVSMLGKALLRKAAAVTIVQSSGAAGGVVTFSLPYCEIMPFKVPDTANDVAIVDIGLRCRDNSGNDMFSMVLT